MVSTRQAVGNWLLQVGHAKGDSPYKQHKTNSITTATEDRFPEASAKLTRTLAASVDEGPLSLITH
jgi:hypothetical protein